MNESIVYFNGECIPVSEAHLSVYDGGWLHGAGLFETMRARNGRVFQLDKHLDRLCASAERLLAPIERSRLPDAGTFRRLLEVNGLTDARVRLTVSVGDVLEAAEFPARSLTVCATAAPLAGYPDTLYTAGAVVMISNYRQSAGDPLAGHKTTNYLARLIAMKEAAAAKCAEALWFTPDNLLAEGSISNVFVVKEGVVSTPPVDTPVLAGIARGLVLELCAEEGISADQRAININELLDADEVFLTNTIMQVMPVRRIEQREIGLGSPGPVTRGLWQRYKQRPVANRSGSPR